ncbi:MAG: CopG family transcriptional regulator [Porcipelethomonas sp.]
MKKSVYSIVLSDDVVSAVDELAYRTGTSRSNLINQILAERVSYMTPEKRMKSIFDSVREMMDNQFQIQLQGSDALMSIRSPLRYKYKPTIRYRVELLREQKDDVFGMLSVSMRTQSASLLSALDVFFRLWQQLEERYISGFFRNGLKYELTGGKFVRAFQLSSVTDSLSASDAGKAISKYITVLDEVMKIYFAGIDNLNITGSEMENCYKKNIENMIII